MISPSKDLTLPKPESWWVYTSAHQWQLVEVLGYTPSRSWVHRTPGKKVTPATRHSNAHWRVRGLPVPAYGVVDNAHVHWSRSRPTGLP